MLNTAHTNIKTSRVTKLIFALTGTYQDQCYRPYKANYSDHNLQAQFVESTAQRRSITASAIAGISGQILAPSAQTQGNVIVPNGFSTQRLYFMMEVSHDDGSRQVLSGFTSHADIVHNALDPHMTMHFNQSIMLRDQLVGGVIHTVQTDASHIVSRPMLTMEQAYGGTESLPVKLRPGDVVGSFDLLETSEMYASVNGANGVVGNFLDENLLLDNTIKSKVTNGSSSRYLSSVANSYINARTDSCDDYDWQTRSNVAAANLSESIITADKFLAGTTNFANKLMQGGEITWGELVRECPEVIEISRQSIEFMTSRRNALTATASNPGQSNYFDRSDWTSIKEAQLRNSIPAVMCDFMLAKLSFTVQTCSVSQLQMVNGAMYGLVDPTTGASTTMTGGNSLTGLPIEHLATKIEHAIHYTVLPEISDNYQTPVFANVSFDMFGEVIIDISVNGQPTVRYIKPNWMSALDLPIVGQSHANAINVVNDLHSICQSFNV